MIKENAKKSSKIIFLTLAMLMLMTAFTFNIANATDTLPEVTVDVYRGGLYATETQGDVNKFDNILTRVSDVLLEGNNLYTFDSVENNNLHGTDPGKTITGDMGCVLKDTNGEPLTSLTVTAQLFINVGKDDVADHISQVLQGDTSAFESQIKGLDNILSATYGTYLNQEYQLTFDFNQDGTFSVTIPENVPDNYILAITQMTDPITGEVIDITKYDRLFLALGDASNSNPGEDGVNGGNGGNGTLGEDDGHRYYSIVPTNTSYTDLDPAISSSISSEIYDVETAIPTSENLKYSITADNAIYDIETRKTELKAGVVNITLKVSASYPQKHTEIKYNRKTGKRTRRSWTTIETVERTITTTYSYEMPTITVFDVPKSNIYPVASGSLQATNYNYVLSSGTISLTGSATKGPQVLGFVGNKPNVSNVESEHLGYFSSRSAAVAAIESNDGGNIKNRIKAAVHAAVGYYGNTNYSYYGLNVTTTSHNGVMPVVAKTSGSTTGMIPSTYPNGLYVGSGSVFYAGGFTFGTKPNDVIVHTPVVNRAYISWVSEFVNQKINIDSSRTYLMLDEEFTITIPDNGTHNSFKGYGTRYYNTNQGVTGLATTWGKIKDVRLPFDSYLHYTKNGTTYKYFIKANTWLSESGASSVISLTRNTYTFTIPVWVTEKTYDIETRVIAENASNYNLTEANINSSIMNYVATKNIPVEIIGKIYDLRVSASNDPGWQNQILSSKTKQEYITAEEFPFGQQGQNKITQYKYAPKLGYTFVFDFKTKGRKSNNIDVSIQPEGFYFVSRDGKTTQEVDLYYNTTTTQNVQITTSDNKVNLSVRLNDAFLKVAAQEFVDSNRIYKTELGKVYNYSVGVSIGTFAKLNMPHSLRLCYNNFAEYVNALYGIGSTENSISNNAGTRDNVIGSVGHWYAGYRLPASTKAVAKGSNIQDAIKNNKLLTDGYILVKFNIKTKYENQTGNYDYLQYMGPEALNEAGEPTGTLIQDWTEGGTQEIILPNGNKATVPIGSVAIYEANLRSSNDAEVAGTH